MRLSCENTEELFSRRFDARLSSVEDAAFVAHLEECETCASSYQRFESVFIHVATVPELEMDLPLPMPQESTRFVKPVEKKPLVPRWLSAAAVVLLLTGVGMFAYDYGRKATEVPDREPVGTVAEGDLADLTLPQQYPGQRLHRTVENANHLYNLARVSRTKQADADRMVRVFADYIEQSPLRDDIQFLKDADKSKLGSFRDPVLRFTNEVGDLVQVIDRQVKRPALADRRIEAIRRAIERSNVQQRSLEMRRLARFFEFPEASEEQRRLAAIRAHDPERAFSSACINLSFGFVDEASRRLEGVVVSGEEGIREPAAIFSLFSGLSGQIDIDGKHLNGLSDIFSGSRLEIRTTKSATGNQFIIELSTPNSDNRHLIRFKGPRNERLRLHPLKEGPVVRPKRL